MDSSQNRASKAAQLKEEGNALFAQKKYQLASAKYTKAIEEDGKNAVLFANRAACNLSLRKYLDAAADAKKATELDPLYSKAWARFASASDSLGDTLRGIDAWRQALATLPNEDPSPAELKQREQYHAALQAALDVKAKLESGGDKCIVMRGDAGKFPWDVAREMESELQEAKEAKMRSSAWVMLGAYQEFSQGIKLMKALKKVGPVWIGNTEAIPSITNAIMRDTRVFHIDDPNWIGMYNNQAIFQAQKFGAWTEGGADLIIAEAQKRRDQQGWDSVRPALTTTIRGYIMRGFLEGRLRENCEAEAEFIGRSLEILEWGQKAWKGIPFTQKGVIFKDTFVRGVRSMYLDALMHAHEENPTKFPLETLLATAENALEEIKTHPLPLSINTPPNISSYMIYPTAKAWAIKGYCFKRMAMGTQDVDLARKSAECYLKAAGQLPEDDEDHAWYLRCALANLFNAGAKLVQTLPIMTKISLAIPEMLKIWARSSLAQQGGHKSLEKVMHMEADALSGLQEGRYTLDECLAYEM